MALILDNKNLAALSDSIEDYPEGIVMPIDKPYRWTSADVIRKIKFCACRHFHKKNLKVGHAGTLDPLATGVLLVCIGKATKLAEEFQKHEKEYVAGVSFGATTPSYDLEKEIDMMYSTEGVSENALRRVLPEFIGEQEQVAPLFSAKSVDGVRAYELARREWRRMRREAMLGGPAESLRSSQAESLQTYPAGVAAADAEATTHRFDHSAAELLNRQIITISEMELLRFCPEGLQPDGSGYTATSESGPGTLDKTAIPGTSHEDAGLEHTSGLSHTLPEAAENLKNSRIHVTDNSALHLPHAEIRIVCSKGTYIRALARDLGEALGSGAHLDSLRRTRTGGFRVSDTLTIAQSISLFGHADCC